MYKLIIEIMIRFLLIEFKEIILYLINLKDYSQSYIF